MDKLCDNCVFNYVHDYDRNTGEVLTATENGGVCQNPRSMFCGQDCSAIKTCGKWVERKVRTMAE